VFALARQKGVHELQGEKILPDVGTTMFVVVTASKNAFAYSYDPISDVASRNRYSMLPVSL